jgi:hypothetical protein
VFSRCVISSFSVIDTHNLDGVHIGFYEEVTNNRALREKSVSTICCSLSVATHGEKMHIEINLVVNGRFFVANSPNSATENLRWATKPEVFNAFFLPQVAMDGWNGQCIS